MKEGEIDKFKPQYLWEDLFGNASIFGKGLSIVWMDNEDFNKVRIMFSARINVKKIEGEATDRMWRFTKQISNENLKINYGLCVFFGESEKILSESVQ